MSYVVSELRNVITWPELNSSSDLTLISVTQGYTTFKAARWELNALLLIEFFKGCDFNIVFAPLLV